MPTVIKNQQRVQTAALPGVRLTAASTPLAEGAGVEQARAAKAQAIGEFGAAGARAALGAAEQVQAQTARVQAEAVRKANQAATLKFRKQFNDVTLAAVNGDYLAREGEKAFTAPEEFNKTWKDATDAIMAGAANDDQRAVVTELSNELGYGNALSIQRHVTTQRKVYTDQLHVATIEQAAQLAILNSADRDTTYGHVNRAVAEIRDRAKQDGVPDTVADATVLKFTSKVLPDVIRARVDANDLAEARAYLAIATKDKTLDPDAAHAMTTLLESASVRGQAQDETERILAKATDLESFRDEAKKIDDRQVRDEVLARGEHEFGLRKQQAADKEDATLKTIADILDKTPDVRRIPTSMWADLSPSQREGFRVYVDRLTTHTGDQNDPVEYYRLRSMAVSNDPKVVEAFKALNLTDSLHKLGKTQFESLVDIQTNMKKPGAEKKVAALTDGIQTNEQIVNGVIGAAGLDPTPDPVKDKAGFAKVAQFRYEVDRQVTALGVETASNEQIKAIATDLMTQQAVGKAGLFSGPEMQSKAARNAEIPDADYQAIVAELRRGTPARPNGTAVTADSVWRMWQRTKEVGARPVDRSQWDLRPDGSKKGLGFLGPLPVPGKPGQVASEYSIGTSDVNGKEMDIPTLVPTLTPAEVTATLKAAANSEQPPRAVIAKAVAFAKQRLAAGKSVYAQDGEQQEPRR